MRTTSSFLPVRAAACLFLALALAAATGWHAMIMTSRTFRPAVALLLDAGEPIALGQSMTIQARSALSKKQPLDGGIDEKARKSLRSLALNPIALRFLAISGGTNTVERPDRRLLQLSDAISRRDLGTQMLLVADQSRRGDIKAVLRAYDKALRTSQAGRNLIFAPLGNLVSNPLARREFGLFFDQKAEWLPSFLVVGLNQTNNPDAFFDLLITQRRLAQIPDPAAVQDVLVNTLIAKDSFSNARKAFAFGRPGQNRALTSPTIDTVTLGGGRNTLYWFFPKNPGVNAVPFVNRYLTVAAEPGNEGTVAQKLLFLPPGRYRLITKTDRSQAESGLGLDWSLQCLRDGSPARPEVPLVKARSSAILRDEFMLDSGCDAVLLLLRASRPAGTANKSDRVIEAMALDRIG